MGFGVLASSSGRVDFSDTETSGKSGGQSIKPKDKKPRTYFPETWVWNNKKTESVDRKQNYKFFCKGVS